MAEEPGLFGDEEGAPSPFFVALDEAERALGSRRGRPPGARNRKSVDFERWYHAAGYKDPAVFLAELVSADPMALARAASVKIVEAIGIQQRAAAELLPYLHGKKPTEVVLTDERLPTLIVVTDTNQLEEARVLLQRREALAAGVPLTIEGSGHEKPGFAGVSEGDE
jgi:hypothetical protein